MRTESPGVTTTVVPPAPAAPAAPAVPAAPPTSSEPALPGAPAFPSAPALPGVPAAPSVSAGRSAPPSFGDGPVLEQPARAPSAKAHTIDAALGLMFMGPMLARLKAAPDSSARRRSRRNSAGRGTPAGCNDADTVQR